MARSAGGAERQGDTLAIYPPVWEGDRDEGLRTVVLTEAIATALGIGTLIWGDAAGALRHPYYVDHERLTEAEAETAIAWHRFALRCRDLFRFGQDTSWYELDDENAAVTVAASATAKPEPVGGALFTRVVRDRRDDRGQPDRPFRQPRGVVVRGNRGREAAKPRRSRRWSSSPSAGAQASRCSVATGGGSRLSSWRWAPTGRVARSPVRCRSSMAGRCCAWRVESAESALRRTMASISLEAVRKVYPNGFEAVHGLDLEIADGELMVVVGPSGCGKTTVAADDRRA